MKATEVHIRSTTLSTDFSFWYTSNKIDIRRVLQVLSSFIGITFDVRDATDISQTWTGGTYHVWEVDSPVNGIRYSIFWNRTEESEN